MPGVYRRATRTAALASIAAFALALLACGGAPEPLPEAGLAPGRPRPFALATLLLSRSFALVDVDPASGRALARASDGTELFWSPEHRRPIALPHAPGVESIALFPDGDGRLARAIATTGTASARLLRIEADGRASLLPVALADARLAGRREDSAAMDLAGAVDGGGEAVFALAAANRVAERLAEFPPGFVVSAISADGGSIATRRALHPEADELLLLRRASGEMRLLLPSGDDARFRPLAFDRSARSLLLLTDERSDVARLEWLDLDSGERRALAPRVEPGGDEEPDCDLIAATLSRDGRRIAATAVCSGHRELRLLDAGTGQPVALPLLPAHGRAVSGALGRDGDLAFVTVSSPRTPRDLVAYPAGAPDPLPLTWGLAPGIDPALLLDPIATRLPMGRGVALPVELWLPDTRQTSRSSAAPPAAAVLWLEGDRSPPAWGEFEPLFQFLAGRGIAVARFRLRGADGFGRAFRHAADGRPIEAALEDLAAVRRELERRVGERLRIALVGDGPWPGAVATALAFGSFRAAPDSLAPANDTEAVDLAAVAAFDADADPLRRLDEIVALAEPAKSWWTARWGAPDSASALSARAATRADLQAGIAPLLPLFTGAKLDRAELWRFLAPHLEPSGPSR